MQRVRSKFNATIVRKWEKKRDGKKLQDKKKQQPTERKTFHLHTKKKNFLPKAKEQAKERVKKCEDEKHSI